MSTTPAPVPTDPARPPIPWGQYFTTLGIVIPIMTEFWLIGYFGWPSIPGRTWLGLVCVIGAIVLIVVDHLAIPAKSRWALPVRIAIFALFGICLWFAKDNLGNLGGALLWLAIIGVPLLVVFFIGMVWTRWVPYNFRRTPAPVRHTAHTAG